MARRLLRGIERPILFGNAEGRSFSRPLDKRARYGQGHGPRPIGASARLGYGRGGVFCAGECRRCPRGSWFGVRCRSARSARARRRREPPDRALQGTRPRWPPAGAWAVLRGARSRHQQLQAADRRAGGRQLPRRRFLLAHRAARRGCRAERAARRRRRWSARSARFACAPEARHAADGRRAADRDAGLPHRRERRRLPRPRPRRDRPRA